jgi:hypothetical protein
LAPTLSPFTVIQQPAGAHAERACDAEKVQQANVSLTTLDATEVRPVHSSAVREFLLRHA